MTTQPPRRPSASYSHLSEADALDIKKRIWHGEICEKIASDYEVSVSTIRSIGAGIRWALAVWPETDQKGNPLSGGLPKWRRKEIALARRTARHQKAVTKTVKQLLQRKDEEN